MSELTPRVPTRGVVRCPDSTVVWGLLTDLSGMNAAYLTLAEAAARLGVHPRTIERRIRAGTLDAETGADGRVRVRIEVPDAPDTAPDTLVEHAGLAGAAGALVAREVRETLQGIAEIHRRDAERLRRRGLVWAILGSAGLVAGAGGVAAGVATIAATREASAQHAGQVSGIIDAAQHDRAALEAARAEVADLRARVAGLEVVSDMSGAELRQTAGRLSDVSRERDEALAELACVLDGLERAVAGGW